MKQKSYLSNYPVSVLDKLVRDDDDLPIGMTDSYMAAGTPRDSRRGGMYNVINATTTITNHGFILKPATNGVSFSFWINTNSGLVDKDFRIFSDDSAVGIKRFRLRSITETSITIEVNFNHSVGSNSSYLKAFPLSGYGWQHIVLTSNSSSGWRGYVNGELVDSSNLTRFHLDNTVEIPFFNNGIATYNIFELGIINRQLELSEILDIYKKHRYPVDIDLLYKMDENSGTVCYDSSGNGYHGTIMNAITTPPEEDSGSIHQYQDVYSWPDEVGFSLLSELTISTVISPGDTLGIDYDYDDYAINLYSSINSFRTLYVTFKDIKSTIVPTGSVIRLTGSAETAWEISGTSYTLENGNFDITFKITDSLGRVIFTKYNNPLPSNITFTSIELIHNKIIPRDESITLPPFKDVLGNDLQYIGQCPAQADFVESPCFEGDGVGYLKSNSLFSFPTDYEAIIRMKLVSGSLAHTFLDIRSDASTGIRISTNVSGVNIAFTVNTTSAETITAADGNYLVKLRVYNGIAYYSINESADIELTTQDGSIAPSDSYIAVGARSFSTASNFMITGQQVYDVKINELDSNGDFVQELANYPLCEPIIDAANHTYHDISGNGNHATLINGSTDNQGVQDVFHWGQNGLSRTSLTTIDVSNYTITGTPAPEVTINNDILEATWAPGGGSERGIIFNQQSTFYSSNYVLYRITGTYSISSGQLYFWTNDVNTLIGTSSTKTLFDIIVSGYTMFESYFNTRNSTEEIILTLENISFEMLTTVPASSALDGTDALGNQLTLIQDGYSFLDTGTKLQHRQMARVLQMNDLVIGGDSTAQQGWDYLTETLGITIVDGGPEL